MPLGALQPHGSHLPLGLDLLVAEAFAARLGRLVDGIVLPALLTPVTTAPQPHSLQVSTAGFRIVMDDTLDGLVRAGWQTIAVVSGHYAPAHEIELYEAAMRVMDDHPGVRVFAAAPLEPLADEGLLDHAGQIETSLLMAIRPDLVRLDEFEKSGVVGEDPRGATAEEGERLLHLGLEAWVNWMSADPTELTRWYGVRFDVHQPFVDAYFKGSWEDANLAWWADWSR